MGLMIIGIIICSMNLGIFIMKLIEDIDNWSLHLWSIMCMLAAIWFVSIKIVWG